jgi:putative PIN family toxin of toxin-antitoxin system
MYLIYAVIDTNVLISALITKNTQAPTVKVLEAVMRGNIIPLYHKDILTEYDRVLHRSKFKIEDNIIQMLLDSILQFGIEVFPQPSGEIFIDMDDLIFYEVAMEKSEDNAYLVTGNQKHYPIKDFIVTPAEMIEIMKQQNI